MLVLIHQRLSVEQCLCVACVISVFIWLTRRPRMKIKRMKTINKPPIEIIFHSSIRRGASVSSLSWLSRLLASLFSVGDSGDNDDEGDVDTVVSICWDDVTDGAIVLSFWTPCNGAVKTGIQGRKTHVRLNSLLWDYYYPLHVTDCVTSGYFFTDVTSFRYFFSNKKLNYTALFIVANLVDRWSFIRIRRKLINIRDL